jgi:hypothetical protein
MLKQSPPAPHGYDPGRFSDLANTPLGQKVWHFLNDPENVNKMMAVSDVGKPAVAGLGSREHLVTILGEEVATDRWKRTIGHMVRQIMERHPYELVSQGQQVKVIGDSMFSKGSRYRRRLPHWGHMYLSAQRPGKFLWSDLGIDDLTHALAELDAFVRACLQNEFRDAKIVVSERNVPHSRPTAKAITLDVKGAILSAAHEKALRSALGARALAPNVDIHFKFSD